jgi:DNA processing protein
LQRAELKAWLRLTLTAGVGNDTARKLLAAFGSAEAVFDQSEAALRQLGSNKLVQAIITEPPKLPALVQATVDWLAGDADRVVAPIGSASYPAALLNIEDPPLVLYMMGSQLSKTPSQSTGATNNVAMNLAIVGSRNPTPQGQANARQFAKAFAEQGLCIVSGLALGVDGAAHDGALLGGGATVAVVGTGLDRVYPKKHLELAHRIAASGLIISEFPIGTPPINANFPKRNRIISGLSVGTLVVEAALRSGSLITARLASEQGKDVFAIPGSIHSPQSRGCHFLIKQGAKLVETAQDVMEELKIPHSSIAPVLEDDKETPEGDSSFLSALGFDIVSLDALQARTGWPTPELQARLLELELDGLVMRLPGGLFQRMAQV